ncbi:hypothetical protein SORBI_3K008450 [Sorghum bicolor]|uniref:Uncharacterized protein n=1 Tax=Sorghum bicolor TaxID=4558 RepID=A0A1W0VQT1_SORBI|nr:hypothetical protein SORBI_3K008450 [Sorghum bicolor]
MSWHYGHERNDDRQYKMAKILHKVIATCLSLLCFRVTNHSVMCSMGNSWFWGCATEFSPLLINIFPLWPQKCCFQVSSTCYVQM